MKTCTKCQIPFPSAAFCKNIRSKDGLQHQCRACNREHYLKTRDAKIAVTREYRKANPEKVKAWRKTCQVRQVEKSDYREKILARKAVANAVRRGKIVKPDHCADCFKYLPPSFLHGHHEDYTKPLDVSWLCATCHGARHRTEAVA